MRESTARELWVGCFVLIGLAGLAWLSFSVGGVESLRAGGLQLTAAFDEIGGLKRRAQVVIGGVRVGQVESIDLAGGFRARVTPDVDESLELPADTSASILTAGVLGDQYIALEPGGDPELLVSGEQIQFTQSAVILERLIGKLVQNIGSGGDEE